MLPRLALAATLVASSLAVTGLTGPTGPAPSAPQPAPPTPQEGASEELQVAPAPEVLYPNVLVILADDLGVEMLPSFGFTTTPQPITPNLDQLVAKGLRFTEAWANPKCSPTRATILTGRYGYRTGIGTVMEQEPAGGWSLGEAAAETTIPMVLGDSLMSYRSGAFGKWHLESPTTPAPCPATSQGFDVFMGHDFQVPGPLVCGGWEKKICPGPTATLNTGYVPTTTFDDAITWMTTASDQRFFCYLAPQAPYELHHTPDPNLINTPLPSMPTTCSASVDDLDRLTGCDGYMSCVNSTQTKTDCCPIRNYVAAIEALDTEIGRLLTALGPNWWKTTTVFFIGDNGTPNDVNNGAWPCGQAKATVYNGGIRVPFLVSGARVLPSLRNTTTDALVNTVDVFRTASALTRGTVPGGLTLDGKNLLPLLRGQVTSVRSFAFAEMFQPNGTPNPSAPTTRRAIRDEFYKVIRICGQNDQVYDAVTDPTEQNDLWTPTLGTGVAQIDVSYNFLDCELRKTYLCPGETACP